MLTAAERSSAEAPASFACLPKSWAEPQAASGPPWDGVQRSIGGWDGGFS